MKSLNTYIFEVNNDIELFNMVNEVLNNEEYTYLQIEESFNDFNLLFEGLNKDKIQDILKKLEENYPKRQKALNEINKEKDEALKKSQEEYNNKYSVNNDINTNIRLLNEKIKRDNEIFKKWSTKHNEIQDKYNGKIDNPFHGFVDNAYTALITIKETIKHTKKLCDKLPKNDPLKKLFWGQCYSSIDDSLEIVNSSFNSWLSLAKKWDNVDEDEFINNCKEFFEMINFKIYKFNGKKIEKNPDAINKLLGDLDKEQVEEIADKIENNKFDKIEDIVKSDSENNKKSETASKKDDSEENQSEEEQKEQTTEVISDNKDLLTPIAKAANVTGEQLLNIITKLCVDKKGKARKLEDGVIVGLSIMICGMLLSIKKNGKSDNSAIKAIVDKMKSIMDNKKAIKSIIK